MGLRNLVALSSFLILCGCYAMQAPQGGGMTRFGPPRVVDPGDVALPEGYRIQAVASGFTFPTGVAFDDAGGVYVVEAGYSYGEVFTTPRLLRIRPDGASEVVASGGRNGPWTGATFRDSGFYVAEGGELEGGRILRIERDGHMRVLVDGLPSRGDHHTNGVVAGPDGWLYFGQGTATNSGVVGPDNAEFGWLHRYPDFHDVPCRDVALAGQTFISENPLSPGTVDGAVTGAFAPFGRSAAGRVVAGRLPCNGAIFRIRLDGGPLELVAWGFRNPFGLAFASDGRLYVTENGYDARGSRPVFGAGDLLWRVEPGAWYGWPDFHGEHPLYEGDRYAPVGGPTPPRLLAQHPNQPPKPVAVLGVHSSSNGFDFARNPAFGHLGQAFIAQFGDQAPDTGKVLGPVGFKVVRVDVDSGVAHDFAVNRGPQNGPASLVGGGGLERPVSARFDPSGESLYVVDFGVMTMGPKGPEPRPGTGVLWRISRTAE